MLENAKETDTPSARFKWYDTLNAHNKRGGRKKEKEKKKKKIQKPIKTSYWALMMSYYLCWFIYQNINLLLKAAVGLVYYRQSTRPSTSILSIRERSFFADTVP